MRLSRLCFLVCLILFASTGAGCKEKGHDSIPVVGLDSKGLEIQDSINMEKYSDAMGITLSAFNKKMGESLRERERPRAWQMSAVVIALSIGHDLGLGLVGLNATPTIVLLFLKQG